MAGMDGSNGKGVAGHFGKQLRRDRLAHGWSITELAKRTGINAAHLGRVESGHRPPTARIADALDGVFTERRGWYLQWLDDIRTAPEIPATFRSWGDYEDRSATLRAWTPGIIDGLAQTEGYAAALIATEAIDAVTAEARLKARMARQQRILGRDSPPRLTLLVDEAALYRQVGTAEVMAGQFRHLLDIAARPTVTLQVMPEVAHASVASAYLIADDAVWAESVIVGGVHVAPETLTATEIRFDNLRGECLKVSESAALIERQIETWTTGGSRPTPRAAADSA
jgi:transcriptional regulator with XRE-family HTH domain